MKSSPPHRHQPDAGFRVRREDPIPHSQRLGETCSQASPGRTPRRGSEAVAVTINMPVTRSTAQTVQYVQCRPTAQGLTVCMPASRKCRSLRVIKVKLCARHMAAIMQSTALIGLPKLRHLAAIWT